MTNKDRIFLVMSPTFLVTEDLGFGQGPSYEVRECKYVRASDHSEAKWKFISHCRQIGNSDWIDTYTHPLSGVSCKIISMTPREADEVEDTGELIV